MTGYLRIPKFRGDGQVCLADRPTGRTQGRTVVITALCVTSNLAGRLRPPPGRRPARLVATSRVATEKIDAPAAGPEKRRAIDFRRGFGGGGRDRNAAAPGAGNHAGNEPDRRIQKMQARIWELPQ